MGKSARSFIHPIDRQDIAGVISMLGLGETHQEMADMNTGERVKQRRAQLGLTQEKLEEMTGIDQGHISMIENGKRKRPSGELLVKLARALRTTVEDLVASTRPVPPRGGQRVLFICGGDRISTLRKVA